MKYQFFVENDEETDRAASRPTLDRLKETEIIAFNSEAERAFCDLLCQLLDNGGKLTQTEAIQEASFELNISPVTAKRYLLKHTSRRAQFCIQNKLVVCKAHDHSRKPQFRVIKNHRDDGRKEPV